ncbi:MAG: FtsW/RodA/SpoVE family cell cycle protein [Turicibacter sp.]|nr:FtsW/RodA/SpoVE family cell cycle protein [Turicibacter sp.]
MDANNKFKTQKARSEYIDGSVFVASLILSAFGVLMVFSITGTSIFNNHAGDRLSYMTHSVTGVVLGVIAMMIVAFIPNQWYRGKLGYLIIVATAVIFIITPFFGRGAYASPDVRRWLAIGNFVFQAVDLARIGFVLSLAWLIQQLIDNKRYYSNKLSGPYLIPLAFIIFCALTVIMQPDLGSALVIFGMGVIVFLSSGLAVKQLVFLFLIAGGFVVVLAVFGLYGLIRPYQITRIAAWLTPFEHDNGLQTAMGFVSIALGGRFGVGLGHSTQALGFAIEPHTDLIVTILAEELGFVAVLVVIILYFWIAWRCFTTAFKARDVFSALVCIGIGSFFLLQPFVNLGGASGIIPLSGVTLPLISYGMTSKLSTFVMLGIYFNVRKHVLLTVAQAEIEEEEQALMQEEMMKEKIIKFPTT